jgi:hypothetical protein
LQVLNGNADGTPALQRPTLVYLPSDLVAVVERNNLLEESEIQAMFAAGNDPAARRKERKPNGGKVQEDLAAVRLDGWARLTRPLTS